MFNFIDSALAYISANSGMIGMILGFIWVAIAKIFSNEKAGPVVAAIQKGLDLVAKACEGIGKLAAALSLLLANMIKSDGILGKK